jgi:thiamine-monophosphate kinase
LRDFPPARREDLLFTTDQMIEGVHFRSDASAVEVGHRALARSLSDIAAMGGEPRFCLVSLAIPQKRGSEWIKNFYGGLMALARRTKTAARRRRSRARFVDLLRRDGLRRRSRAEKRCVRDCARDPATTSSVSGKARANRGIAALSRV